MKPSKPATTASDLRANIEVMLESARQKEVAAAMGISESYLSDYLNGRRPLGPKMLAALGYRRVIRYEKVTP